ncbi:threonine/serine dehydratase [Profundibacter sp.]|uniref:threonine/serine dehydratase n=1 Tax=Profundibacter sp. TaxID=3101071 RepID=UPI003D0C3B88
MDDITLEAIKAAQQQIAGQIIHTPVLDLRQTGLEELLPKSSNAVMKLELFQKAGSFKARGNLLSVQALTPDQRAAGVTAASGGNHALALAWAAQAAGTSAKIAIPKTADPIRIDGCRALGAELVLCDDIHEVFSVMEQIADTEGRSVVHPFEGYNMSLGAATCGAEMFEDTANLDVVILPVGGGGLISGMSKALKLLNPSIEIFGVEPYGADSMFRSFQSSTPERLDKVETIADSLGSPTALPYSYELTRENVTDIARVTDDELRATMRLMNSALKLMVEPACAASLTGALGPLKEHCAGKNIGLLACGANISRDRFMGLVG